MITMIIVIFFIFTLFIVCFEFFSRRKSRDYYKSEQFKNTKEYLDYHRSYYGEGNDKKISDLVGSDKIDPRINGITQKIREFSQKLLDESNDLPTKLKIETIRNRYLHKIISAYQDIPVGQRDVICNGASAYTMTADQLETLFCALKEIETQMLEAKHQKLKINEKVIKGFQKEHYL